MPSLKTAHFYNHTKLENGYRKFSLSLCFFLWLSVSSLSSDWLSFETTFLWSLYLLLCVGEWGRDGDKEKDSTFSRLCHSLLPLCHSSALISPAFFHFFLLSHPTQILHTHTNTNNFRVTHTVCAHTNRPPSRIMGQWDKDTNQYRPVWAQSWITGKPYCGSVPQCVFVGSFVWGFLNFLVSVMTVSMHTYTETSTYPTLAHSKYEYHPLPLLTFAISLNANINISIPFYRHILTHKNKCTHRQAITLLLYIQILPWLCLWLNSLSLRRADAIVSSLWLPWTQWDLRSPFWLNRLTVALHPWAPTCSGMKLQGNIWLPLPRGLPA